MVELTFTTEALDERRTVEGKLRTDDEGRVVVEEPEESRPNWRVENNRTVTLISEKSGNEIREFGLGASMDGYCLKHGVHYERLPDRDHCPRCRMERERERAMAEQQMRTTWVDDPVDPHGYRDEPPRR